MVISALGETVWSGKSDFALVSLKKLNLGKRHEEKNYRKTQKCLSVRQ